MLPTFLILVSQDRLFTEGQILLSLMFSIRITSEKEEKTGIWFQLEAKVLDFSQAEECTCLLNPAFSLSLRSVSYTWKQDV